MRYFLDPFGCAKNQVDAENMMACLGSNGWSAAGDAADADLIIVNSCGFIESAKQESINAVLLWRRQYPEKKILLAGCLAQRYAKDLAESLPEADAFFGVDDISKITETVNAVVGNGEWGVGTGGIVSASSRPLLSLPGSAYVKISEGCDNRCSFCAIPLIRGPLHCRAVADIVEECRGLLARGVKELCIIGQDIGSYRSG
ncbi:MAG: 30S ribosomal protein S12 methylthiotransferase RimO, partial [Treponema sp.]|nr:30S ribosomal protein S12 methylthiotransferase RimO [Treponema sp.]